MAKHNFRTSVRNGDIIQGDTRPGEVVTYRLSAEELAKYGPPAAAKRRRALDIRVWTRGGNRDMKSEETIIRDLKAEIAACEAVLAAPDIRQEQAEYYEMRLRGKTEVLKGFIPEDDLVNHPAHYTAGKVECIDALEAAVEGLHGIDAVLTASVIKYMWRWQRKGGLEDLRKAEWYLQRLIGREEA